MYTYASIYRSNRGNRHNINIRLRLIYIILLPCMCATSHHIVLLPYMCATSHHTPALYVCYVILLPFMCAWSHHIILLPCMCATSYHTSALYVCYITSHYITSYRFQSKIHRDWVRTTVVWMRTIRWNSCMSSWRIIIIHISISYTKLFSSTNCVNLLLRNSFCPLLGLHLKTLP